MLVSSATLLPFMHVDGFELAIDDVLHLSNVFWRKATDTLGERRARFVNGHRQRHASVVAQPVGLLRGLNTPFSWDICAMTVERAFCTCDILIIGTANTPQRNPDASAKCTTCGSRHRALGGGAVVVLASHLHGEHGRPFEKRAGERSARPKGDVRTERAPVRQVDEQTDVVGQDITAPGERTDRPPRRGRAWRRRRKRPAPTGSGKSLPLTNLT